MNYISRSRTPEQNKAIYTVLKLLGINTAMARRMRHWRITKIKLYLKANMEMK